MTIIKTKVDSVKLLSLNFYKITLKPISPGYSQILANTIRQILFTCVFGYAVTEVKINNSLHEYDNLIGVKENVLEILLNIKGIIFKLKKNKKKIFLNLKKKSECIVRAKDIIYNKNVKILNPNHIIANLSDKGFLKLKIKVEIGKGYIPFNPKNCKKKLGLKGIPVDACFSPIIRVSYFIERIRNELYNNLEKINFYIETNGTITAKKALNDSIGILLYQLSEFKVVKNEKALKKKFKSYSNLDANLFILISDIEFTIRALKCIDKLKINYLGDLVRYSEEDLLKVPNFGKRTLDEIKKILIEYKLALNTKIENWDNILKDYIKDNFLEVKI